MFLLHMKLVCTLSSEFDVDKNEWWHHQKTNTNKREKKKKEENEGEERTS